MTCRPRDAREDGSQRMMRSLLHTLTLCSLCEARMQELSRHLLPPESTEKSVGASQQRVLALELLSCLVQGLIRIHQGLPRCSLSLDLVRQLHADPPKHLQRSHACYVEKGITMHRWSAGATTWCAVFLAIR